MGRFCLKWVGSGLFEHRHAELVSASIKPHEALFDLEKWTLKQVQGDREAGPISVGQRRIAPSFILISQDQKKGRSIKNQPVKF
jgi:hypothetical protein